MNCQLNVKEASFNGHGEPIGYRATNKEGSVFYLCRGCVDYYKKSHSGWPDRGVTFQKLTIKEIEALERDNNNVDINKRSIFSYQP